MDFKKCGIALCITGLCLGSYVYAADSTSVTLPTTITPQTTVQTFPVTIDTNSCHVVTAGDAFVTADFTYEGQAAPAPGPGIIYKAVPGGACGADETATAVNIGSQLLSRNSMGGGSWALGALTYQLQVTCCKMNVIVKFGSPTPPSP